MTSALGLMTPKVIYEMTFLCLDTLKERATNGSELTYCVALLITTNKQKRALPSDSTIPTYSPMSLIATEYTAMFTSLTKMTTMTMITTRNLRKQIDANDGVVQPYGVHVQFWLNQAVDT
jgi:hypothetical protein